MRRNSSQFTLAAVSLVCVLILAACGTSTPVLRYLTISPTSSTISATTTQQYTATAYYSDGTFKDGTSLATWGSSNPAVATIAAGGVATAVAPGTTTISATASGVTAPSASLSVNQLLTIVVTPGTATISAGQTQQYAATGTFKNAGGTTSPMDVTSLATWSSVTGTVATISNTGLATGLAAGSTGITAALYGVTSPAVNLTVGAAVAASLQVSPATPTAAIGNGVAFTAQELYTDGTLHAPAGPVTWTSDTPATATILANSGLSSALAAGTTNIIATEGALTGNTGLTVVTGSAHYAYVANNLDNTLQWYTVNATTSPYLTSAGTVNLVSATQAFLHPNGQFLYATDSNSDVYVYNINSTTGAPTLSSIHQPQAAVGTNTSNYGAVDPYGRFLYEADSSGNNIYGFQISQTDGSLTAIAGSPFTANASSPQIVIIDRSGNYLYAVNQGSNMVSAYTIDQTSGALTPIAAQPTIATGNSPQFATQDPSGTHVYVANDADGTVSGYSIGTGGVLTSLGAATTVTGAKAVFNVAVDPSGKYLYVLDTGNPAAAPPATGQLYGYNIGTGGVIGAAIAGTPVATGLGPTGIAIDPTSSLIAVDNSFSMPGTISLFSIGTGGALTADTPVNAGNPADANGSNPLFVIFYVAP